MTTFLVRRIAGAVVTMFIISTLVFIVTNLIPGSPASIILGEEATPLQVASLNHDLGLDQPAFVRYFTWLLRLLSGDLGTSYYNNNNVGAVVLERLEPTLVLTLTSTVISVAIGVAFGIISAINKGRVVDHVALVASLVGTAMPSFWLGLLLILLFALYLGLLPVAGYVSFLHDPGQAWRYMVLPAVTLGASHAGVIARMTRANLLEVMSADYLRTARSKGLNERSVILKHALRNSLIPTFGVVGVSIALMMGGSVITESIFAIPGIGRLLIESVQRRDFPMIQGVVLLIALLVAVVNLAVDVLYMVLDPRVRV